MRSWHRRRREMSVQLQANQAVWVEVVGGADSTGANCLVVATTPERITLRFTDSGALPAGLVPGCSLALRMVNEQGVHTAVAKVAQVATKPHAAVTLRAPLRFATTQMRKFVRVGVKLPVVCTVRASRNDRLVGECDRAGRTQDLSAGGMRLSTSLPLRVGDELDLKLKVRSQRAGETELSLSGRVLRVGPGEKKPRMTLFAGIELIHANQREQDALVLLVFELQRKSLA